MQRGELRRRDERLSNVGERIGCRSAVRGHLHRPAHARLLLRLSRSRSSVALRHVARERPVRIHAHPPEGSLSSPVGVLVPERTLFVVFVVFGRISVPGSTLGARWRQRGREVLRSGRSRNVKRLVSRPTSAILDEAEECETEKATPGR